MSLNHVRHKYGCDSNRFLSPVSNATDQEQACLTDALNSHHHVSCFTSYSFPLTSSFPLPLPIPLNKKPTPDYPFLISLGFAAFKDFLDIYGAVAPVISILLGSSLKLVLPICYQQCPIISSGAVLFMVP